MLWHVKDGRRTDIPEDHFHAETFHVHVESRPLCS
jgi:hypothetical protein